MKVKYLLPAFVLLLAGCNGATNTPTTSTSNPGGESSPTTSEVTFDSTIGSGEELKAMVNSKQTLTGNFTLESDIFYDSYYSDDYAATIFNGTFSGNNHTITILAENLSDTGIFYKIGEEGLIRDLKIRVVLTAGDTIPSVGALANYNHGTVQTVSVYGESYKEETTTYQDGIYSTGGTAGDYTCLETAGGAGGIVGTNYGTVQFSKNYARVSAVVGGGGIAGVNKGTINECYNLGAVGTTGTASSNDDPTYTYSVIGGIAGLNEGTIKNSINENQVFVTRYYKLYPKTEEQKENDNYSVTSNYRIRVGGIAGMNLGKKEGEKYVGGIIENCMNFGRIHGDMRVGGIAGESNGLVSNCLSSCFQGARESLGGIVGYQKDDDPGKVEYCIAINRVQSNKRDITLDDGTTVTAPELTNNKGTSEISNIVNYYKVAKYADNCLGHNNCGEIDPIGENNTTSTGNYKQDPAEASFANSGAWSKYVEAPAEMAGLNKSYQVYLHNHLNWQEVSVDVVDLAGNKTTLNLLRGVDYTQILTEADGTYSGNSTGIKYGCHLGVVPGSELANLGVKANSGMKVKFVTDLNNKDTTEVDIITGNQTVYAIQVAA